MMSDIFSVFDPTSFSSLALTTTMTLSMPMFLFITLLLSTYPSYNRITSIMKSPMETMFLQLSRTTTTYLKGMSLLMTSLFILIIFVNTIGMSPYTLSLSSHLIMTLSIGLPLWLSLIISSIFMNFNASTAHFLPDGAPDWLNPFLVLIETTSILVRPITLSFRLAANMTAGHIVLTLVSMYMSISFFSSTFSLIIFVLFSSLYIMFELAICLIQAYIFCLLISLYSDDHAEYSSTKL